MQCNAQLLVGWPEEYRQPSILTLFSLSTFPCVHAHIRPFRLAYICTGTTAQVYFLSPLPLLFLLFLLFHRGNLSITVSQQARLAGWLFPPFHQTAAVQSQRSKYQEVEYVLFFLAFLFFLCSFFPIMSNPLAIGHAPAARILLFQEPGLTPFISASERLTPFLFRSDSRTLVDRSTFAPLLFFFFRSHTPEPRSWGKNWEWPNTISYYSHSERTRARDMTKEGKKPPGNPDSNPNLLLVHGKYAIFHHVSSAVSPSLSFALSPYPLSLTYSFPLNSILVLLRFSYHIEPFSKALIAHLSTYIVSLGASVQYSHPAFCLAFPSCLRLCIYSLMPD